MTYSKQAMTMKVTATRALSLAGLALAGLALAGCQRSIHHADAAPVVPVAAVAPKRILVSGYNWRATDFKGVDAEIIEKEQGTLAMLDMADCELLNSQGKVSHLMADKCDMIAAQGYVIQQRRASAENEVNAAYDLVHPKQ